MTIARPATGKLLKDKKKKKPKSNEEEITSPSDIGRRAAEQNRRAEKRANRPIDPETGRYIEKKKGGSLSVSADKPAWMRNR
tara:strand:- start:1037 stop:1282 length:246 start_codon:yes stop_codon:yes gene_type:complete